MDLTARRRAVLDGPLTPLAWRQLAEQLAEQGDGSGAALARAWGEGLSCRPGEATAGAGPEGQDPICREWLEQAKQLLDAQRWVKCLELCTRLEARAAEQPTILAWCLYFQADAQAGRNRPDVACELLERSLKLAPISYASLRLAQHRHAQQEHERAHQLYQQALNARPPLSGEVRQLIEAKCRALAGERVAAELAYELAREGRRETRESGAKRYINPIFTAFERLQDVYGRLNYNPLVSILVVAYNSNRDLRECLQSIERQTYRNLEVVIVDNGDQEVCEELAHEILQGNVMYIKEANIGFAAANNRAAAAASGDLFLLLNPDACLAEDSIKQMVSALRFDGSAGIVAPQIFFRGEFLEVAIDHLPPGFALDLEAMTAHWEYRKVLISQGRHGDGRFVSADPTQRLVLQVPINRDIQQLVLKFDLLDGKLDGKEVRGSILVRLGRRARPQAIELDSLPAEHVIALTATDYSSARRLINNAGSALREDGTPFDRGFAEEDRGQFAQKEYIRAFCGCCALIRRSLFAYRKLFIDEYFAYFEDSELSYWCEQNKIPILYCPTAHVDHRHSESTSEKSPTWRCLVRRSRLIYQWIRSGDPCDPAELLARDERYNTLKLELNPSLVEVVSTYDEQLRGKSRDQLITREGIRSIAIYNTYMNTYGGGEKHMLGIAQQFSSQPGAEVTIICEQPFDVAALVRHFDLIPFRCSTLIVGSVTPKLTAFYDCLINSTHRSNLISLARKSYYLVSFPGKNVSSVTRKTYHFLHNSEFTADWAQQFWGPQQSTVVYPVVFDSQPSFGVQPGDGSFSLEGRKENCILSVGRFNYGGHCKNHHRLVQAFQQKLMEDESLGNWTLQIIGSVDYSSRSSVEHHQDTLAMAATCGRIDVIANAESAEVAAAYRRAKIYVHATGLDVDPLAEPHRMEHFGIAVYDGLLAGCACLVFASGGPVQQVAGLQWSSTYGSEEELGQQLAALAGRLTGADPLAESQARASMIRTMARHRLRALVAGGEG
ncbi:MAG: glycosyltransferase [Cyanobacteria bacterium J06638_7]